MKVAHHALEEEEEIVVPTVEPQPAKREHKERLPVE
jgi:hypothetical protein